MRKNYKLLGNNDILKLSKNKLNKLKFNRNMMLLKYMGFPISVVKSIQIYLNDVCSSEFIAKEGNEILVDNMLDVFDIMIESNYSLEKSMKEFLKSTKYLLEDNKEFLNVNNIVKFISELYVDYDSSYLAGKKESGMYICLYNYILLSSKNTKVNTSILLHEVLHGYAKSYSINKTNRYLNELATQLFTIEYQNVLGLDEFESVYDYDIPIIYMLAHLTNRDIIKKFMFNNDYNIIRKELIKKGASLESSSKLLEYIDNIHKNINCENSKEQKENNRNLYFCMMDIHESISNISYICDIEFISYIISSRMVNKTSLLIFSEYLYKNRLPIDYNKYKIVLKGLVVSDDYKPSILYDNGPEYIIENNADKVIRVRKN